MCQHQARRPQWPAPDHLAARIAAGHPEQGWSMLCNGVIVFDDDGELLPDGAPSRLTGPRVPSRWQWPPEVAVTLLTSWAKARRAHEDRACVRELLWKREPAFAAELATAEQDFPVQPYLEQRHVGCHHRRVRGLGVRHLAQRRYLANYTDQLPMITRYHALLGSAHDGLVSAASRRDYAAAAAAVLTQDGHLGATYELGGRRSP